MTNRECLVRRGFRLAVLTIVWNIIEGVVAICSGIAAGSVALVGFGADSCIETASAIVVGWRFAYELKGAPPGQVEKAELWSSRIIGSLLLALATYLLIDSGMRLLGGGREPHASRIGIAITLAALVIMPLLARAKLQTAKALGSKALRGDSFETIACAGLAAATLSGLILNAVFGWWWADPLAALAFTPLIVREGLEGLRGDRD